MPRTTLGLPHLPDERLEVELNCLCSGCHQSLVVGQWVREQALYKCFEFDSIEIGHAECCPEMDNAPAEGPPPDRVDHYPAGVDLLASDLIWWREPRGFGSDPT